MSEVKVAIVGAGMAGLTAALRLADRGYKVTVYEQKPYIGGQFGAHTHGDGLYHEHSYHMLLNWYHNFWKIAEDVGVDFERDVEARLAVRHLARGGSRMPALTNPGSPRYVWENLFSGVAPPPDMFLYAYSLIDLIAQPFEPGRLLDEYTVNGFLQSRPYASERSAELHHDTLAKAFASPSYLSSAISYKNLIRYGFRDPEPMMWILKGNSEELFHRRFRQKLDALKCEIKQNCRVTQVTFQRPATDPTSPYRAVKITYTEGEQALQCFVGYPPGQIAAAASTTPREQTDNVDYLILAAPPRSLGKLVVGSRFQDVHFLGLTLDPQSKIRLEFPVVPKFKVQPMASLDLYFNKRLPGIPKEHVVLLGSEYGLTFIDNSQAWAGHQNTVLNVIASDFLRLSNLETPKALEAILVDLQKYVSFDLDADVDKAKTHFQTNIGDELFVNEVGSEKWRPEAKTPIPNLFLAGDYCRTVIDVITIEAAVVSGLEAAKALQTQVIADLSLRPDDKLAEQITIIEPDAYSEAEMAALKLWLAPWAYAAKMLSWLNERLAPQSSTTSRRTSPMRDDAQDTSVDLISEGMKVLLAPWAVAADFWRAGWSMWGDVFRQSTPFR